jgi:hypothetical protein
MLRASKRVNRRKVGSAPRSFELGVLFAGRFRFTLPLIFAFAGSVTRRQLWAVLSVATRLKSGGVPNYRVGMNPSRNSVPFLIGFNRSD